MFICYYVKNLSMNNALLFKISKFVKAFAYYKYLLFIINLLIYPWNQTILNQSFLYNHSISNKFLIKNL